MRCSQCGYRLEGLAQPRCPECARPFDPADDSTFDPNPVPRVAHPAHILTITAIVSTLVYAWCLTRIRAGVEVDPFYHVASSEWPLSRQLFDAGLDAVGVTAVIVPCVLGPYLLLRAWAVHRRKAT